MEYSKKDVITNYEEFVCLIERLANTYGNQTAFEEKDSKISFEQFYNDIILYSKYFAQIPEKRIAILGATSYMWICHAYSAACVGKDVILVDPLLPRDNIVSLLEYSDAEILYMDEEDKKLSKMVDEECHIESRLFNSWDNTSTNVECKYQYGDVIFFTSGTSGKAKGVVMGFDGMYRNAVRLAPYVAENIEGNAYMPLPLSHLYSNCMVMVYLLQGRTLCLGSPRTVICDIENYKPSVLTIVPSIAEFVLKNEKIEDSIKVITVAGAKCEKSLEQMASSNGIFVQNIYGASEFAGVAAVNRAGYKIDEMMPVVEASVTLENGDDLVVFLPDVMKEYYKRPEETEKVLKNGKIYLGDQGVINENGSFMTLGRKQDMIAMKNGSKLYCLEIDEELSMLEGVKEACVIYADDKVVATIVANDGMEEVIMKALKAYNKKQPYFRKIEDTWFRRTALPRTSIGKLKRTIVTQEYLERQN